MSTVLITDVTLRDGLQIVPRWVPTPDKLRIAQGLPQCGVRKIELTSFTSPKAIPSLADADELASLTTRDPQVCYTALVPNLRGAQRALAANMNELNFVFSASEAHNQANLRMNIAQSLAQLEQVLEAAEKTPVNVSLSTAFGCPFTGAVAPAHVIALKQEVQRMGASSISLCDTTGMGSPVDVERLTQAALSLYGEQGVTGHFHDTRGLALANAWAAYREGGRRFDAALAGLGGCPYAPGASGNASLEDLAHMFQISCVETGLNLEALQPLAEEIATLTQEPIQSRLHKAGPAYALKVCQP